MASSILPVDAASAVCSIETQTIDSMFECEEEEEEEEEEGGGGGDRTKETAHSHTQT